MNLKNIAEHEIKSCLVLASTSPNFYAQHSITEVLYVVLFVINLNHNFWTTRGDFVFEIHTACSYKVFSKGTKTFTGFMLRVAIFDCCHQHALRNKNEKCWVIV